MLYNTTCEPLSEDEALFTPQYNGLDWADDYMNTQSSTLKRWQGLPTGQYEPPPTVGTKRSRPVEFTDSPKVFKVQKVSEACSSERDTDAES